jgi:hypothetical protein
MSRLKEGLSIGLLVAGVTLVFVGVTRSVGFSLTGIIASLAAVVALLYSGAVFFGASPAAHSGQRDTIFVFDRTFRLVSGTHKGLPIRAVLSGEDVESRCSAVFTGKSDRFAYGGTSHPMQVDVVPVRDADGTVVFGMLIVIPARPVTPAARV